jgi:WhiB family transcriptional regulator, redox-sensing transcriptional regulator
MSIVAEARPLPAADTSRRAQREPVVKADEAAYVGSVTSPAGREYEVYNSSTEQHTYMDVFLDGDLVQGFAGYGLALQAIRSGELDKPLHRPGSDPACWAEDPELFFPIGHTGPAALQIEEAKAVCHRCPVMAECRADALARGEEFGVWGGLSEQERRALQRRNGRGRDAGVAA